MPATTTPRLSAVAERRIRRTATGFVIFVALAAAVLSFTGLYELALGAGFHRWIAPLFPLATDVAVAAFSLAVLHHSLTGMRVWYPWMCMLLGVAVSVAGNVWAAPHNDVARLVHAWPPIVFALAFEALTRLIRHRVHVTQAEPASAPAPEASSAAVAVVPAASAAPTSPSPSAAALTQGPAPRWAPVADADQTQSVTAAPQPAYSPTPAALGSLAAPDVLEPLEAPSTSDPESLPIAPVPAADPTVERRRHAGPAPTARPGSVRERVIAALTAEPGLSAGELARRLDADPSNVSKIVKKVRADGLVPAPEAVNA